MLVPTFPLGLIRTGKQLASSVSAMLAGTLFIFCFMDWKVGCTVAGALCTSWSLLLHVLGALVPF